MEQNAQAYKAEHHKKAITHDFKVGDQAWYAEFLLEIDLKILLRKTEARLIFKIIRTSLHIDPGAAKNFQS
jgi:hypothetical protein